MAVKKLLIDTNIYSLALKGDESVVEVLREVDEIGFSVISIGELLSGFRQGGMERKNRQELEQFLNSPRVVIYHIDEDTTEFYSQVVTNLRQIGKPIPTNDIWIAAVAFQNGLKLFTRDSHFQTVPGLFLVK
jgi:tRNA(fMet)-specific endonuclease VapC